MKYCVSEKNLFCISILFILMIHVSLTNFIGRNTLNQQFLTCDSLKWSNVRHEQFNQRLISFYILFLEAEEVKNRFFGAEIYFFPVDHFAAPQDWFCLFVTVWTGVLFSLWGGVLLVTIKRKSPSIWRRWIKVLLRPFNSDLWGIDGTEWPQSSSSEWSVWHNQ